MVFWEVGSGLRNDAGRLGEQVDISDISRLPRMPISQDSLSNPMGQHRDQTEKIFPLEPINS